MVRPSSERVLLIGDSHRQLQTALAQALPGAQVTSVATVFDGIGELSANEYTTVLAAAEPIERRPEPAVRVLRQLTGAGRLVLFGHPTLEILSRKMLHFGCDDYIITPPNPTELEQLFDSSPMRMTAEDTPETIAEKIEPQDASRETVSDPRQATAPETTPQVRQDPPEQGDTLRNLPELPFADIFLEAMIQHPHDAAATAVRTINSRIGPFLEIRYTLANQRPAEAPPGRFVVSEVVRAGNEELGTLQLLTPANDNAPGAAQILAQLADLLGKVAALQDRHNRLQKLAISDDLTGLYNARYFRHFLTRIVERAKVVRFPVTLLLFDIDDFKKYNDQYGHGAGDEILKQTAKLMRRCCREHDLVARIGGDEFAVVFWDKEGPRQPLDPKKPVGVSRPPQTPVQMFERFKRLAASSDFSNLGPSGTGRLSVSGGLAVYPYDAQDVQGLIKAADDYLMFRAKKAGKNSVYLVEGRDQPEPS